MQQVPGIQRRRVGKIVVTAVNDGSLILPDGVLQGIDVAARDQLLYAAGRRAPFRTAINTFLLQWPGHTVLVDTGAGVAMGPAGGKLLAHLHAAGVAPEQVDTVLLTHLHIDHYGGLLDGAGAPVFPRAAVMVAAAELSYWESDAARDTAPEARRGNFEGARRAVAPYAARLHRFTDPAVLPGVAALPLAGHTPGHTGFEVRNGGDALVIWGDTINLPEVQSARPDVSLLFDTDPGQAAATRRAMLERAAAEDLVVAGMHIGFPGFARVVRVGDGFALQPLAWEYELSPG